MHASAKQQKQKKVARAPKAQQASKAQQRVKRMTNSIRPQSTSAKLDRSKPIGHMGNFLAGKSALVTGSTSGIGLGVAKVLAGHGCNITLNGFGDATEIAKLQKDLAAQFNVKVRYSPADMTKPQEIRDMVAGAQKDFGSLDILVNNAGIQHISSVEQFPEEKWDQVMAINLDAVFHTTKAAIPHMKNQGFGRIINIASVHGHVASVNKSAYIATKHAVVGFTKATALELSQINAATKSNITAVSVCPGWVLTPLVEKQIQLRADQNKQSFEEAKISLLSEKQPSQEFVTVEDLGNTIAFLSSPYSAQITGSSIIMDGAWVSQ